ncbi:MAG: GldG family protein [Anaerolineales bacterium]|nr:GldG family protein [Anaerolineales bacterium]GER80696.1 conserved hypothetical protein [Candidatus Denitrolinea symbiosum]
MKKNYPIISLYVSLAAFIALALTLLTRGAMALGIFTPAKPETIDLALLISGALVILGLAVYAILAPDSVRIFLGGRQARYGSNALVMVLAFTGIVLVTNYLAFKNPKTLVDMTEDKSNTLAPEMAKTLQELPSKMTAVGYFSPEIQRDQAEQLLSNMKNKSQGNFDYRFADPVANPVQAKSDGVTGDGKIVLEMSGRKEIADYADQTELLRAMNRLLNPEARAVYFLAGHGELNIEESGQAGLSRASETLTSKNYTVKTLNLLADNAIPQDARAVIVAGPQQPLTANEVKLLMDYTLRGGALIVMEGPVPLTDFGDKPDPLADSLDRVWGIRLRNDFVVDQAGTNPLQAIGAKYSSASPATNAMALLTIFPMARSIELTQKTDQGPITLTSLVETSPSSQAWGETDFSSLEQSNATVSLDPEDTPGPLTLAASAESIKDKGRVIVFGNAIFASDEGFDAYGNGDLFINAVDWCAGADAPVDITVTPPTQRVFMPPSQLQMIAIIFGSICVLPGLALGAGAFAWLSRQRRG